MNEHVDDALLRWKHARQILGDVDQMLGSHGLSAATVGSTLLLTTASGSPAEPTTLANLCREQADAAANFAAAATKLADALAPIHSDNTSNDLKRHTETEWSHVMTEQASRHHLGDRVAARHHLGGFFRATVRRGTRGVVIALSADGAVTVAFANGNTLTLHPDDITLTAPPGH